MKSFYFSTPVPATILPPYCVGDGNLVSWSVETDFCNRQVVVGTSDIRLEKRLEKSIKVRFRFAMSLFCRIFAPVMIKTLLITLAIVAVCVTLLSVRLFFGRPFIKFHIDQNKALRERGIRCVQAQDAEARRAAKKKLK